METWPPYCEQVCRANRNKWRFILSTSEFQNTNKLGIIKKRGSMRRILHFFLLVLLVMASFGCAATTSKLDIDARHAIAGQPSVKADGPPVYIRNITDGRIFTDGTGHPGDPTPTIQSAAEKETTIGRKRNGFGKAWGSFRLSEGKTVKTIIRSIIEESLMEDGFNVLPDLALAPKDTIIIDVNITKFWLWTDFGFWQGHLVTDIATTVKTPNGEIQIEATERLGVQMGTESNAMLSIHNALVKYRIAAKNDLKQLMPPARR